MISSLIWRFGARQRRRLLSAQFVYLLLVADYLDASAKSDDYKMAYAQSIGRDGNLCVRRYFQRGSLLASEGASFFASNEFKGADREMG